MEFVDYLQGQYFINLIIVAVLASWALWRLAARLPKGWLMGIVGLVPALCIGLLISSVVVFGWMLVYAGGSALGMITRDPGGALQFVWLLAIEFGLYAIVIAMIVYVVARFRGRHGAAVRG